MRMGRRHSSYGEEEEGSFSLLPHKIEVNILMLNGIWLPYWVRFFDCSLRNVKLDRLVFLALWLEWRNVFMVYFHFHHAYSI